MPLVNVVKCHFVLFVKRLVLRVDPQWKVLGKVYAGITNLSSHGVMTLFVCYDANHSDILLSVNRNDRQEMTNRCYVDLTFFVCWRSS